MKKVKLTYDQVDEIVLTELKEMLSSIMADPWPMYHDLVKSKRDADAFLRVISYISTHADFELFNSSLDYSQFEKTQTGSITIDEILDNPDGSAEVKFSASPDQLNMLAGEGVKYLLMKGVSGKTDDEIMELIT
jgi:hypothetical protein